MVIKEGKRRKRLALCVSLFVLLLLVCASIGKFLNPSEYLKGLDRFISLLELIVAPFFFFFRKRWQLWAAGSLLFFAWSGYALFWYGVELPCGCMGSKLHLPSGFTLTLDIALVVLSLLLALLLGMRKRLLILLLLIGVPLSITGYSSAQRIFNRYVFEKRADAHQSLLPDSINASTEK